MRLQVHYNRLIQKHKSLILYLNDHVLFLIFIWFQSAWLTTYTKSTRSWNCLNIFFFSLSTIWFFEVIKGIPAYIVFYHIVHFSYAWGKKFLPLRTHSPWANIDITPVTATKVILWVACLKSWKDNQISLFKKVNGNFLWGW